jgi:spore coat protein JA
MFTQRKAWYPYVSPFDPCDPIVVKTYETPPELYLPVQPPNLPQYDPFTALKMGTLWPTYYSPYDGRVEAKQGELKKR